MARYDANRNRGHNTYGSIIEPGYGGRKPTVVGYSATSESYVATREQQVVEYGSYPVTAGHRQLYKDHGVGDHLRPWNSALDRPKKGDKLSPKSGQRKSSPRKIVYRDNSPPSGDHYYGKYNSNVSSDDDDNEDDVICEDGVCYPKPKHNKDEDYEKEKHRAGNGYAPAGYPAPHSTQNPRKDPHYETSYPDNYYEKPKGNNGYGPPSYTSVTTQPRMDTYETSYPDNNQKPKGNVGYAPPSYTSPVTTHSRTQDPYYETSNNRPIVNNPPPPVKTRPDTSRGEYRGESNKNSPVSAGPQYSPFAASPRKHQGYPETIDSAEARKRYARGSPRAGAQPDQKYGPTIDSRKAAEKYGGVFVPN